MLSFLQKRWFLVGLLVLIPGGFLLGSQFPPERLTDVSAQFVGQASRIVVFTVLFLMSVTLDSRKLWEAARSPAPVLWATAVNFIAIPLAAIPLMQLQGMKDFSVGLMIAASVPCTMAAASVWTRKAGGNDAVSLLVTIVTNGSCFLVTPFWLNLTIGQSISLDLKDMVVRLLLTAMLPILLGQVLRLAWSGMRMFADRRKTQLGVIAQACLLVLVFWASVQGGPHFRSSNVGQANLSAVGIVWGSCMGLHLAGFALAITGGRLFRFAAADMKGAAFAGSQKTLPIGVYIATDLLAGYGVPFAVFPILMFHASQLFLDTILLDWIDRWTGADTK